MSRQAHDVIIRKYPRCIATISAGFEKGDFLAFNYIAAKGYSRMPKGEEGEWMDLMESVHASVKGGMKYNTGRLLMVLHKPLIPQRGDEGYESGPRYGEPEEMDGQMQMLPMP
ncbi:hypothetical protein THAOC_03014 [Thalassiosira oceanica]|uniref:Uncharacterized protein n=1 Tax=Thalassiosira oceanica TaxID=159749 RepID=K0T980_THAOC|nr:hypothetical protein THAOC_03014 [Thalassiosira oceanica]|eukprot:EJK75263.1 hypothetical protein THAOC_03014 [Thalassiosira oceanica]